MFTCDLPLFIFYPIEDKNILIQCPCFPYLQNLIDKLGSGSCLFGLCLGSRSQIQSTSYYLGVYNQDNQQDK